MLFRQFSSRKNEIFIFDVDLYFRLPCNPVFMFLNYPQRMGAGMKDGLEGLKLFIAVHQAQLISSGVPEMFWPTIYHKLKHGVSIE